MKTLKREMYCAEDSSVQSVGSTSAAGKMSPNNLWSNTITDELRMATNFRNKTISIALKDRGAVLPGGHTSNGSYWFDNATGGWISSTYYMQSLPEWVRRLNEKKLPDAYLKQNWNTLYPINTYKESTADDRSYENYIAGSNCFPHRTDTVSVNKYELFRNTPYGNTFTLDMAKAAVENEQLGLRGVTDFLAISFSSTDYVGHAFGPNSIEAEDIYLRLDKDLGAFLKFLDAKIGKDQYLIFLSADHGAAHVPAFTKENKMPGGTISELFIRNQLNEELQKEFNVPKMVSYVMNYQVYLNDQVITENHLDPSAIKKAVIRNLLKINGVSMAFDPSDIQEAALPEEVKSRFINGYNQKLSGDIQYSLKPQWFAGSEKGTTHGLWNPYDAHIPLLWFGWGIKKGKCNREVYMTDIAPTIAAMLHIEMPNASVGKVIEEVTKGMP
jgi:predicted AlkP superfamily pyrophosphatase or phosphodiesterase